MRIVKKSLKFSTQKWGHVSLRMQLNFSKNFKIKEF